MKNPVQMAQLTADAMRKVVQRQPVILLPLGSFEDQGPHMPMGDYLLADIMAQRIATAATEQGYETYTAPVLPFGGADYFGYMPGGIALSQTTLRAVLQDMLTSLIKNGFKKLVIINGHGGNCTMIHDVTQALFQHNKTMVPSFYLWRAAAALLPDIVGVEQAKRSGGHGANPLTSIGQYLLPELVKAENMITPDQTKKVWGLDVLDFGTVSLHGVPISVPLEGDKTATQGVGHGDPHFCNAETGKTLTEKLVQTGVALIAHMNTQPPV
ncbi:MAG: creatininase family protein [Acetobacter orientalis]|uniref:creatininase family protein n=1 Tax=Acetobacter orientalis TaxID=146474 RepID=UPI0039EC4115